MRRRQFSTLASASLAGMSQGSRAAIPDPEPMLSGGPVQDWFIFLERGSPAPKDQLEAMQRGHIDNFKRLFGLGLLLAAGPLQDPSGHKRGIVVARAVSLAELQSLFVPDDYVRGGHMRINASPCLPRRPLNTTGISPENIEEQRIALIGRSAPGAATSAERTARLQAAVNQGRIGAWYSLTLGPIAEVLLLTPAQADRLASEWADWPGWTGGTQTPTVWSQWLSKGVLPS